MLDIQASDDDEPKQGLVTTPSQDFIPIEAPDPPDDNNIVVVVRKRPQSVREKTTGGKDVIKVLDGKLVVLMEAESSSSDFLRHHRTREKQYMFDHAFDETCSQRHVYENTTKFLIDAVASGYNASVFAYGSTGAGKTYTMIGTSSQPGIMILALEDLFAHVSAHQESVFRMVLSYLEVYNENLRDLLKPSSTTLSLREDPVKGIQVAGLTEFVAHDAQEVMELLHKGNANRTTEPTAANQTSSRSHAVLQIIVEQKDRIPSTLETVRIGKLSLIDLAGSERAAITQNRGIRMIEGANINRSLLALGNCITALGANSNFVPFRDSKLTRVLKDSLGGNTRTVMISNVSPCDLSFEDTHNTLKYANRAKNIRTHVRSNVLEVSNHLAKYTDIISGLRREIASLKCQMQISSLIQQRRSGSGSLSHQLELEHWLSSRDMTTWTEARQKLQSMFEQWKQIAETVNTVKMRNLEAARNLRKARILERLGEPVGGEIHRLEKEIAEGNQQIQRLKDQDLAMKKRENDLRGEVGAAGGNGSQTISQILDMEMAMHGLKVDNLRLCHGRTESDQGNADWIESLEDQIRIRDKVISDQEMALHQVQERKSVEMSRGRSGSEDPVPASSGQCKSSDPAPSSDPVPSTTSGAVRVPRRLSIKTSTVIDHGSGSGARRRRASAALPIIATPVKKAVKGKEGRRRDGEGERESPSTIRQPSFAKPVSYRPPRPLHNKSSAANPDPIPNTMAPWSTPKPSRRPSMASSRASSHSSIKCSTGEKLDQGTGGGDDDGGSGPASYHTRRLRAKYVIPSAVPRSRRNSS